MKTYPYICPNQIKQNNMSEETLTPQEKKEQYLQQLEKRIEGLFASGNLTAKFETAQCAPSYGWSVEEYMYMPIVAQRLRAKGYSVTSSVNWEVTDWVIAV